VTKPRHIAIIMDGNGRWAAARGLGRVEGHRKGAEAAKRAVETARDMGVEYVTLFSFSSENWKRPESEISDLMNLLRLYLRRETAELHKSGARLVVIGNRVRLPEDIVRLIESAESLTKDNNKITVVIALSYGGREDILFAAKEVAKRARQGTLDPEGLTEAEFAPFLMTAGIPDPDLLIRTSGESRVSNFLMWQIAYAELFFTDTLWPDFSKTDMEAAIAFYAGRERRYGARPQDAERG
jgi:undecaprenyl diphosphate synthase